MLRLAAIFSATLIIFSCSNKTDPVELAPTHDQIGGTGGYNSNEAANFGNQQRTDPYQDCNFNAQTNVASLLNFNLRSPVLSKSKHTAQGTISSLGQSQLTVTILFTALSGITKGKVQDSLNQKVNSTGQVTPAPVDSWEKMYVQKDPKLTQRCGVVGVSQLQNQSFSTAPFPYMIAPSLSKQRAMYEFGGTGTTFNMTIGGVSGTSRFTIVAESNVMLPGAPSPINADYAVRVQHTYGNAQTSKSLGLAQSTIYYVKGGRFIAISEETGDADFPIVSFF